MTQHYPSDHVDVDQCAVACINAVDTGGVAIRYTTDVSGVVAAACSDADGFSDDVEGVGAAGGADDDVICAINVHHAIAAVEGDIDVFVAAFQ